VREGGARAPSLPACPSSAVIQTPRRERNATSEPQLTSSRADFFCWVFIPTRSHCSSEKALLVLKRDRDGQRKTLYILL